MITDFEIRDSERLGHEGEIDLRFTTVIDDHQAHTEVVTVTRGQLVDFRNRTYDYLYPDA